MSQLSDAREPLDPVQSALLDELIALPDSGSCEFIQKVAGEFVNSPITACVGAYGDKVTFESGPTTIASATDTYGPFVGSKAGGAVIDVEGVFAVDCTVTSVRVFIASNTLTTGTIDIILTRNGVDVATIATITSGITGLLTVTSINETYLSSDTVYYRFAVASGAGGQTINASISTEVEYSTSTPLPDALPINGIEFIGADWGLGGSFTRNTAILGAGFDFSLTGVDVLGLGATTVSITSDSMQLTGNTLLSLEAPTELRIYTAAVDAGTATVGQALLLVNAVTGETEFGDVSSSGAPNTLTFETTSQAFGASTLTAYSQYFGDAGASNVFPTVEADVLAPFSEAVTVKRVRIFTQNNVVGPVDINVTLRKNGVDTATVITIPAGQEGYFETTSNESFLSTDDISYKISKAGTATSGNTYIAISTEVQTNTVPTPDTIVYSEVTVSAAQIRNCFNTPVDIIGAPGAGKAIQVLGISFKRDYVAPFVFTGGSGYQIQINQVAVPTTSPITGNIILYSSATPTGFILGFSSSAIIQVAPQFPRLEENVPVILSGYSSASNPSSVTGGDDLTIYLTYRIINL